MSLNQEIEQNVRGLRRNNSLLSVYDGQRCIGHVLARGKTGFEAFGADQHSLGIFPNQKGAAEAIAGTRTCTQSS